MAGERKKAKQINLLGFFWSLNELVHFLTHFSYLEAAGTSQGGLFTIQVIWLVILTLS